ncbi:MAG: putative Ig domain-containing protein [bacterium]
MENLIGKIMKRLITTILLTTVITAFTYGQAIPVTLPDTIGAPGTIMKIPIYIGDLTGKAVKSFDFRIAYDSTIAKLIGTEYPGTFAEVIDAAGGLIITNWDKIPDTLSVAAAGTTDLTGSGRLIYVKAELRAKGKTNLTFTSFNLRGGLTYSIKSGSIIVDRKPVLNPIPAKTIDEGKQLSFTVTATDPDADAITFSLSNPPMGASINATTGVFTWIPTLSQSGSYSVMIRATDALGLSDSLAFSITVSNVNQKPAMNTVSPQSTSEGQLLVFTLSATDPDGDALTYSSPNSPQGSSLNQTTGAFAWTPSFTQAGAYPIIFKATDTGGLSDSIVVTITVTNVNQKPVITPITAKSVAEGQALSFNVTASDADADLLVYTSSNLPSGAALNQSNGAFSWTPSFTQAGSYSVSFKVTDSGGLSDSTVVSITVTDVNRKPTLLLRTPQNAGTISVNVPIKFTVSVQDLDKDTVNYTWKVDGVTKKSGLDSTYTDTFTGAHNMPRKVTCVFTDVKGAKDSTEWNMTLTEVAEKEELIPTEFSLGQNFPNPFNPTTTIYFSLPKEAPVTFEIYNMIGIKVRSLFVGKHMNAGIHSIVWDATNDDGRSMPSGVYFYRISGGENHASKKMTLVR